MIKGESMRRKREAMKNEQGFTLIEIMVVLIILGLLAGLIGPRLLGRTEDAKLVKAEILIETLETALKLYRLDNGKYPTTEQGLEALVIAPETGSSVKNWRKGGYIEKGRVPKDPWGNNFLYLCPGVYGDYDIVSYGSDGVQGGEGKDIQSWNIE
jgi:general secretion pathway protein G